MKKPKILAICGSTKVNSTNELILKSIANICQESLEFEIYTRLSGLPHFNPDLDNDKPPKIIREFRDLISNADGVLFSTPEYVFSLPGSLKNALEWTVSTTIFSDKPAAFIIAGASGEKAFESLDLILKTIGANVGENSKLIIKAAKSKLDGDGELTDEDTLKAVEILIAKSFMKLNNNHSITKIFD
jgi:chromate reductase, NAD(P)H dehydrogenase (quinone)